MIKVGSKEEVALLLAFFGVLNLPLKGTKAQITLVSARCYLSCWASGLSEPKRQVSPALFKPLKPFRW